MKKILMLVTVLLMSLTIVACNNTENPEVNYTVTFESNGGTEVLPVVITEDNQKISEPSISRDDYSLEGWFKESDFTTRWNFLVDVVKSDIVLYAKWSDSAKPVDRLATSDPVVLNLTGAQYGGDMQYPTQQNLGGIATIQNSTEQLSTQHTSITLSYRTATTRTIPLSIETNPLFIYFNWDGSFAVMEDYTMTVDTSRTEQEVLSYNLKDFADLADYEVIVNYVRYKITAGEEEYIYYEGDAMMDSSSASAFVVKNQQVEYNDETDSFDIAIEREGIDGTLATYLSGHTDATLKVIGIQIFVIHREKLAVYWGAEETPVGSNSPYVYYDEVTDLSIATYDMSLVMDDETVPQRALDEYVQTVLEPDVSVNYLAMLKVYYALSENVYPEDPDTVYLTQSNIEYGKTKEPEIGVKYDQNPLAADNTLYFGVPVQANSISLYEDEMEFLSTTRYRKDMEFIVWVGHKYNENGEYEFNSNKTGTLTISTYNGNNEDNSYLNTDIIFPSVPDVNGNMISVGAGDKVDLIGVYSIRYGQTVVNLLDKSEVLHPVTGDPIIVGIDFTMDWIYQGNIPIDLGETTTDEVFVVEQSMYTYKNYSMNINDMAFNTTFGTKAEARAALSLFLNKFYYSPKGEFYDDFEGRLENILPFTTRISNNTLYNDGTEYNTIQYMYYNYNDTILYSEGEYAFVFWQGGLMEHTPWSIWMFDNFPLIDLIGFSRTHSKLSPDHFAYRAGIA